MPRIIDKIKELTADTKLFFSVEFFPPKTEPGMQWFFNEQNSGKGAWERQE